MKISARRAISFSVIAKDVTKPECRLNIYLTSRRAGLSASADLRVASRRCLVAGAK